MLIDHHRSFAGSPTSERQCLTPGASPGSRADAAPQRLVVGQEKLNGTVAIADIDLGRGKLFAMGPEVTRRAQPYATFKLLFDGLPYGPAVTATR